MDFLKKVVFVFFNKYLGLAIEFASSVLLVRYLGAEQYGQYVALYILPTLLSSLGGFGFGPSIVYYINRGKIYIRKYLWTFTFLGLLLGSVYIFLLMSFSDLINETFYKGGVDKSLFLISILFIPIMIIQKYLRSIIRGIYEIELFSLLIDIVAPISRFIFVLIIVYLDYGLLGVVYLPISVQSLITVYMFLYLLIKSIDEKSSYFVKYDEFIELTKFGLKTFLGSAILKSNNNIVMLLATALLSFRDLGIFSLALKLLQLISSLSGALLTVLMPKVSKSKVNEIAKFIPIASRALFSVTFFCLILYLIFIEFIVIALYGKEFIGIVKLIIPLGIATVLLPLSNTLMLAVSFTGDPIKKTYARGLGLLLNLTTCYPLFLYYNSFGFALSMTFSQIATYLLAYIFYIRKFNEHNEHNDWNLFFVRSSDIDYYSGLISKLTKGKI